MTRAVFLTLCLVVVANAASQNAHLSKLQGEILLKSSPSSDSMKLPCFGGLGDTLPSSTFSAAPGTHCIELVVPLEDKYEYKHVVAAGHRYNSKSLSDFEVRFRRFEDHHDTEVVSCPFPPVSFAAPKKVMGYTVAVETWIHHNLFESWPRVSKCTVTLAIVDSPTGEEGLVGGEIFVETVELVDGGPVFFFGLTLNLWYVIAGVVVITFTCLCCCVALYMRFTKSHRRGLDRLQDGMNLSMTDAQSMELGSIKGPSMNGLIRPPLRTHDMSVSSMSLTPSQSPSQRKYGAQSGLLSPVHSYHGMSVAPSNFGGHKSQSPQLPYSTMGSEYSGRQRGSSFSSLTPSQRADQLRANREALLG